MAICEARAARGPGHPDPAGRRVYIMDTFPIVKRKDEEKYDGDYRTKRVILEIYDALAESIRTGQPYKVVGGVRFYERREVKDLEHRREHLVLYLRLVVDDAQQEVGLGVVLAGVYSALKGVDRLAVHLIGQMAAVGGSLETAPPAFQSMVGGHGVA